MGRLRGPGPDAAYRWLALVGGGAVVVVALVAVVRALVSERAEAVGPGATSGHEAPWGGRLARPSERRPLAAAESSAASPPRPTRREAAAAPADLASLHVQAVWSDTGLAAAHAPLRLDALAAPDLGAVRRGATDVAGAARFDALDAGPWRVASPLGGDAEVDLLPGRPAHVVLEVPAGPTVEGVVVDARGAPVPDAEVWVATAAGGARPAAGASSDAEGRFGPVRLGADARLVGARARGHGSSAARPLPPGARGTLALRLVLPGSGGALEGRVVERETGAPVPHAEVEVRGAPDASADAVQLSADDAGRFATYGLAPGRVVVRARAPGRAPGVATAEVVGGETARAAVALGVELVVHGRATRADGAPAAGAVVETDGEPWFGSRRARADADGRYRLGSLPRRALALRARGEGLCPTTTRLEPPAEDAVRWDPVLAAGAWLAGTLVDERGAPLGGWALLATAADGSDDAAFAETAEDGGFVLGCLPAPEVEVQVWESPDVAIPVLALSATGGTGPLRIAVRDEDRRNAHLVGAIRLPARERPDGHVLAARRVGPPADGVAWTAPLDAGGAFRLGPLQAGDYDLSVGRPGEARFALGRRTLAPHEELDLGTLSLPEPGALRVEVLDARGAPTPATLHVRAAGAPTTLVRLSYDPNAHGSFVRIERLPPGSYDVEARLPDGGTLRGAAEVAAGAEASVTLAPR